MFVLGTEHVHCVVWTADAPTSGASREEVLGYIDEHVTARMPSAQDEPELYDLVNRLQRHYSTHTSTCKRTVKYRGKKTSLCRFEFPRPAKAQTSINEMASLVRGFPGARKRPYSLARQSGDEQWINDYNPAIILAWKGNIDL